MADDGREDESFLGVDEGIEVLDDLEGPGDGSVADMSDAGEEEENEEEDDEDARPAQQAALRDDDIHTFLGHDDAVYSVAWHPTIPDVVASGGADDRAFLWRVGQDAFEETQGAVKELAGHEDTVASLAFSRSGALLASGGMDGRVLVWDSSTGALVSTLEGPGEAVEWVRWHPRGDVVLAGAADCSAWMWNGRSGAYMCSFAGHGGSVTCGDFSPDGKTVVTASADGTLRVWDPKTGACLRSVQLAAGGTGAGAGGAAAGGAAAAAAAARAEAAAALAVSDATPAATSLAFAPDGASVLVGCEDGIARVVALASGRVSAVLVGKVDRADAAGVAGAAGLPGGAPAPAAAPPLSADPVSMPDLPGIECVCFPRGIANVAVTASLDGSLIVWDLQASAPRLLCPHPDVVTRLAAHPTRPLVATACVDAVARCWDVRTGLCVAEWHGHLAAIQDIVFSPDGKHVLTGAEDNSARVFALEA